MELQRKHKEATMKMQSEIYKQKYREAKHMSYQNQMNDESLASVESSEEEYDQEEEAPEQDINQISVH